MEKMNAERWRAQNDAGTSVKVGMVVGMRPSSHGRAAHKLPASALGGRNHRSPEPAMLVGQCRRPKSMWRLVAKQSNKYVVSTVSVFYGRAPLCCLV